MVMISKLSDYVGHCVEGNYRLSKIQRSSDSNNNSKMVALLEDCSGQVYCDDWKLNTSFTGELSSNLYCCLMYIREGAGVVSAELLSAKPAETNPEHALQFLPYSALAIPQTVMVLRAIILQCPITALRQFINSVFSCDDIALAFFQLPASREHHHAYPGGLAEHSLEVVTIVQHSLWQVSQDEYWLTIVAALFHDIGKLKVFKRGGDKTATGFVLDHDALTLEILAEPLRTLDNIWPDGAIALRYLLTKAAKTARPLMPCALAIEYADKMSSAQSTKQQAFHQKPAWQRFAKLEAKGPSSLFWRPDSSSSVQGVIS
ncbi:MAG: TraI domain-containing protein [Gammaproteobacteria bacterium]|nr:TraI domain-containing protein [Gammaproteobacteria bacterium]